MKFRVLIEAPCFSRSGYGAVADGLVPILLEYPHFDARVSLINWGNCIPRQTEGPNDAIIRSRVVETAPGQPVPEHDIKIALNMPENSKPPGKIFNINFCAGLETDSWPDHYMAAMNRWDLTVFQSSFAAEMAARSKVKPARKVEILPWCQDTSIFRIDRRPNERVDSYMATVKEEEAMLYVGQVTHGNPWFDRKNVCKLIQCYCEAFKGRDIRPALVLKINGSAFSMYDRDGAVSVIRSVRNPIDATAPIYLLHGEMSDAEMNALYNHPKIIACTSFTRGEGFGGSLLQSSLAGKPTIASDWSGHLDYLDAGLFIPLAGKLSPIPPEAESGWFQRGANWFEVDPDGAVKTFQTFYDGNREFANAGAAKLAVRNARRFNLSEWRRHLYAILDAHLLGRKSC